MNVKIFKNQYGAKIGYRVKSPLSPKLICDKKK